MTFNGEETKLLDVQDDGRKTDGQKDEVEELKEPQLTQ